MLKQLRDQSASIVVKLFLGLLVLSFAVWGLSDIFNPNSAGQAVATAGDTEISQQEYQLSMRRQQAMLRSRGFSDEMLANLNIQGIVVEQLVSRAVYEEEARVMDLVPTNEIVARSIRETVAFQDAAGNFDANRYNFALANQGYTPAYYEHMVGKEVVSNILLDTITAGAAASDAETKAIFKFQNETRDVSYVKIPLDEDEVIEAPSDDELNSYYEANQERFRAPDYRKISYIAIDPTELAKTVEVDPAQIEEAYNQRLDSYTLAETRDVKQMLLPDEPTAKAALAAIEGGKSFAEVALEIADQEEDAINLGTMTRASMPDEKLGEAAFTLEEGGVSQPVEGLFGWYLLHVTKIEGGNVQPLAEVSDELKEGLAIEQAVSEAYDLSNQMDDLIGGGATLEEAAEQVGLPFKTIAAIDQAGLDKEGNIIENLPNPRSFLQFAFDTEEGLDSLMQDDGNDGFFILRVDGVTASRIKSLDEVKDDALALWDAEQRQNKALAIASDLVETLNNGAKLRSVKANDVKQATALARPSASSRHEELPATLVTTVFDLDAGKAASGFGGNAYYVAQLDNVNVPTGTADSTVSDEIHQAILSGISSDLIAQYNLALRDYHSVTVNQGLINRLESGHY